MLSKIEQILILLPYWNQTTLYIKSLGIRLASLQKKMELKPIIVKLMNDPDEMIKEEAYLAYIWLLFKKKTIT
jgi:hypothetical protein